MVRLLCFVFIAVGSLSLQAQPTAKKISDFSISMRISAGMTGTIYNYAVDKNGNGVYTRTVRDTVKSSITFKLDREQLTELAETVVSKAGVYDIPEKVNCEYCADGIDLTIHVNSSRGQKTINGNNPQRVNDDVLHIYKLVKSLVQEDRD